MWVGVWEGVWEGVWAGVEEGVGAWVVTDVEDVDFVWPIELRVEWAVATWRVCGRASGGRCSEWVWAARNVFSSGEGVGVRASRRRTMEARSPSLVSTAVYETRVRSGSAGAEAGAGAAGEGVARANLGEGGCRGRPESDVREPSLGRLLLLLLRLLTLLQLLLLLLPPLLMPESVRARAAGAVWDAACAPPAWACGRELVSEAALPPWAWVWVAVMPLRALEGMRSDSWP